MFLFFILLILIVSLTIWIWNWDCDLELLFAIKFGHSIEKFRGKVIWITGSSSGIGEHLAYVLASVQAKLILSGTNENRLKQVAEKCRAIGKYDSENVLELPFNITDCECHQEMFDKVLKHFNNKLDVLVNNAGRSQRAKFLEIEAGVDKEMFNVNVFGLVNLTRIVLKYFLEFNPDGQFGVTSSTAGIMGVPNSATYTATKHALHGYFESLRTELGRRNIGITLLCVGPVFSNILDKAFTGKSGTVFGGKQAPSSRKMSTDRCAYLIAVALANRIDQAWISIQPVLIFHYISQYSPYLWRKFFPFFFTEKMSNKLRDG